MTSLFLYTTTAFYKPIQLVKKDLISTDSMQYDILLRKEKYTEKQKTKNKVQQRNLRLLYCMIAIKKP